MQTSKKKFYLPSIKNCLFLKCVNTQVKAVWNAFLLFWYCIYPDVLPTHTIKVSLTKIAEIIDRKIFLSHSTFFQIFISFLSSSLSK